MSWCNIYTKAVYAPQKELLTVLSF